MKEYKINKKHFIGGWYIDTKICDEIFNSFKKTNLIINQNLNLKMYLKSKNQVKTISKDAILIKDGKNVVYSVENNIAKLKHVVTGKAYKNSIEIIDGIKAGDLIVIRGNERLRPDQKVQIEGK